METDESRSVTKRNRSVLERTGDPTLDPNEIRKELLKKS